MRFILLFTAFLLPGAASFAAAPGKVSRILWLKMYDRWGPLVFARTDFPPNDDSQGWDGFIGKKMAGPGVYLWQAMVEYGDGESSLRTGEVTLFR